MITILGVVLTVVLLALGFLMAGLWLVWQDVRKIPLALGSAVDRLFVAEEPAIPSAPVYFHLITTNHPYETICMDCGYEWTAIVPIDAKGKECPRCYKLDMDYCWGEDYDPLSL